jgi:flagellar protein FlaG
MNVEQLAQTVVLPANHSAVPDQALVKPNVVATPPSPAPVEHASASQVRAAAEQIDSYLKSTGRNLDIHVDKETGEMIVTVRDAETGEVIRQIPNEETLRLAKVLNSQANVSSAILDLSA